MLLWGELSVLIVCLSTWAKSLSCWSGAGGKYSFPLLLKQLLTRMHQMTQILARRICCCGHNIHIHTDYRNPVEEKGRRGHSLKRRASLSTSATPSREEHPPNPCLDRLLLFFWAPYLKDGPPLLCKGLFWVVIFCRQRRGCR